MPFEVASLILLVAVVGAIVLARREDIVAKGPLRLGISIGRQFTLGSPQAAEVEKQLARDVPGVAAIGATTDLEAGDPAVPVVSGDQPAADYRSPPSTEAYEGENKELRGKRS